MIEVEQGERSERERKERGRRVSGEGRSLIVGCFVTDSHKILAGQGLA